MTYRVDPETLESMDRVRLHFLYVSGFRLYIKCQKLEKKINNHIIFQMTFIHSRQIDIEIEDLT